MDSFQLSYSDVDREEWPGLEETPHVRGIMAYAPGCAGSSSEADEGDEAARTAAADEAAADEAAVDAAVANLSMPALERALQRRLAARRRRVSASRLFGLFGEGGYETFQARVTGAAGSGRRSAAEALEKAAASASAAGPPPPPTTRRRVFVPTYA